ncbi:hypothetical protein COLU111180_14885 [Cohnella lubricantis]
MKRLIRLLPLLAPAVTISLSLSLLYLNPYSSLPPESSTQVIVFSLLVCPALLVVAAFFVRLPALKYISFVLSIPVGFYVGLAGFPSLWSFFILSILCYPFIPAYPSKRPPRTINDSHN